MNNCVVTLLITKKSHPWMMLSFKWLVIIWRGGGSFEIGCRRLRGGDFKGRWTGLWGLGNWTIFMGITYVSPLNRHTFLSSGCNKITKSNEKKENETEMFLMQFSAHCWKPNICGSVNSCLCEKTHPYQGNKMAKK